MLVEMPGGPGSRPPTTCARRSSSTRPPRTRGATSGARWDPNHATAFCTLPVDMLPPCCRSFGYALCGNRPIHDLTFDTRTDRVSALCAFSVRGFQDWRFVSGTFNSHRFLAAAEDMVVPLVAKYPIVVLDNASIHKSAEFQDMIEQAGGIVIFTPPYCWDTTPLDNGAFGWVRRWLQRNEELCAVVGLERALTRAFLAVTSSMARSFYRNCGYAV